jgi:hypothetical protein
VEVAAKAEQRDITPSPSYPSSRNPSNCLLNIFSDVKQHVSVLRVSLFITETCNITISRTHQHKGFLIAGALALCIKGQPLRMN